MKLNERQTLARKRVNKLHSAINDAIDKICEGENYEITIVEINAALYKVLGDFSSIELKDLWEEDEDDDDNDE